MTLLLNSMPGTDPGMEIKTHGFSGEIYLSGNCIAMEDFLYAVEYVLTNTDLRSHDPRLIFIEAVKNIKVVNGFNGANDSRLEMSLNFGDVKEPEGVKEEIKEEVKEEKLYRADKKRRMNIGQI